MKLTWLGHACFLLESASGSVVFDPYAPNYVPGFSLPSLQADVCICSHKHEDHYYPEAVQLSGREHSLKISSFPCYHDEQQGKLRGENLISIVEADGIRAAHMGDLGHIPDDEFLNSLGRIDILMIPIGGFYTIDSVSAAKIVKKLSPKLVLPMHYKGEGFGYDVLETRDNFLSLMDNVQYFDTNSIIFNPDAEALTAILSYKE